MNTGSTDERIMLNDITRIARALERIANALEERQYGITTDEVAAAKETLKEMRRPAD